MTVLRPGSPGYDAHRAPPIARFADARPAAIARCGSAEEVAGALELARREGLAPTVRAGGHDFAGRSTGEGLVVDVGAIDSVAAGDGVADIGAGARLGAVYDALAALGVTIAGGCGPDVGVSGLTLGGGLGILGRRHGLTCDQVLGARVVLADGTVVDCDERREPDLFWLLCGAGAAGAGVVVSWRFRTVPAPRVTVFRLVWADADAEAVLDAWQRWAPETPRELAASMLVSAPADPARPVSAEAFGAMAAEEDLAAEVLGELSVLAGADPGAIVFEQAGYRETKQRLGLLGGEDRPAEGGDEYSRSEFFREPVPAGELLALLRADRVPGEHRTLDFTPWGGAYGDRAADATAFVHRDARFLLKHDCNVSHGATPSAWLDASWEAAHRFGTGGAYANFPDPRLPDEARAYWGANLERVRAVVAAYDPDGLFAPGRPLG